MLQIPLISAVVAVLALIYCSLQWLSTYRRRQQIKKSNNCQPPTYYPHRDPLGLDYVLATAKAFKTSKFLDKFAADLDKHGPTFQLTQFGGSILVTKEPKIVKAVLATDFDSFGVQEIRHAAIVEFMGEGFFVLDGHRWKTGRAQARPALAKNEYGDLARLEKHVARFLQLLPRDGSTVDLKGSFSRLLSSFSAEYFFGRHVEILAKDGTPAKDQAIMEAIDTGMAGIMKRLMQGGAVKWLPTARDYRQASRTLREFVDESIEEAFQRHAHSEVKGNGTFLDDLVAQGLEREAIRNAVITLYIGGTDTTSATMTALCWMLAKYPKEVERLREEVLKCAPPDTLPQLQDLHQMTYLKNLIHEASRLYGFTNTVVPRICIKDTVLPIGGGKDGSAPLFVKKGTHIIMDWRSMHRDPRWWGEDAMEFRPDRWVDSGVVRNNWAFMLFGGGPRACPGQNLAFTNMLYILTRLFQEFKGLESRDDSPWTEHMRFGAEHKYGCQVSLLPAEPTRS